MSFNITNKDRKTAKTTCLVFAVLLAVFLCLSILFGALIPRAKDIKALGDGKNILSQVEGVDGSDYFLMTEDTMYRYDSLTGEEISTFSLSDITDMLKADGKYESLVSGSLKQWSIKCIDGVENPYFLAYDASGNIFRLNDDGKNLSVANDYYLVKTHTVIKGCDNVGEDLYLFVQSNNLSYVQKASSANLKGGISKSKMIWDLDLSDPKVGFKKIAPMQATTGILGVDATEDCIYIFRKGGSIVKVSLDFADCVIDGEAINFFDRVAEYESGDQYQVAYDKAYKNAWIDEIKAELKWLSPEEAA